MDRPPAETMDQHRTGRGRNHRHGAEDHRNVGTFRSGGISFEQVLHHGERDDEARAGTEALDEAGEGQHLPRMANAQAMPARVKQANPPNSTGRRPGRRTTRRRRVGPKQNRP